MKNRGVTDAFLVCHGLKGLPGSMAAAFRFDGVASDFVLSTQFTEFFTR